MRAFTQSEFVQMVLDAALLVKDDIRIINNPSDEVYRKFIAFEKMEKLKLIPKGYAFVSRTGPTKDCPIVNFVLFLSHYLVREELVPIREAVTCAMLLRVYTDAAWVAYKDLTKELKELEQVSEACMQAETRWHAEPADTRH
jgi:hypothetical protein